MAGAYTAREAAGAVFRLAAALGWRRFHRAFIAFKTERHLATFAPAAPRNDFLGLACKIAGGAEVGPFLGPFHPIGPSHRAIPSGHPIGPAGQAGSAMHVTNFRDARVVVVDSQLYVRKLVQDALRAIGFAHVDGCHDIARLAGLLDMDSPDLILLDIDEEQDSTCRAVQEIRKWRLGRDPFVVVVALTWHADRGSVAAALDAGADDLLAKPVSAQILKERVGRQVAHRKKFVVSTTYMGPDRRSPGRPASSEDLPSIDVPNNLRYRALGDPAARADEGAIAAAMRALRIQMVYRLARRLAMLADAMMAASRAAESGESGAADAAMLDGLEGVAAALDRIEMLVALLGLGELGGPVNGVRAAYAAIGARGGRAGRREIDRLGRAALGLGNALALGPETAELVRHPPVPGGSADLSEVAGEAAGETPGAEDPSRRCA